MNFGTLMAATALLAPIPFLGTAAPASASVNSIHIVQVNGSVQAAEKGRAVKFRSHSEHFDRTFRLTSDSPKDEFTQTVCSRGGTSGEARAELHVTLQLMPDRSVLAVERLRLYEESVCSNGDQDGEDWVFDSVRPGTSRIGTDLYAQNKDEMWSDDFAYAHVTIHHEVKLPAILEQCKTKCRDKI